MRSRSENHVLWPVYFDIHRSRADGRMVSKKTAVEEPTCEDIFTAAKACGFTGEIDADSAFPGEWHKARGRVHVVRTCAKSELLKKVSAEMRRMKQKPATQ
ncbi:MAG: signal recognition particle subunit SRP19/SEC65 family protein [Methanobacteriota archaeon]